MTRPGTGKTSPRRLEYARKYREANMEKVHARSIVNNHIKLGKLTRKPCEKCGEPKSHAHHDDYSRPLDVKWLCRKCHGNHHVEIRSGIIGVDSAEWARSEAKRRSKEWRKRMKQSGKIASKDRHCYPTKRELMIGRASKLRDSGLTYRQIGTILGVNHGWVYQWLSENS